MRRHPILYAFLAIGLIAALVVAFQRSGLERRSRSVSLVVDYDEAAGCAASSGRTPAQALADLRSVGITGVAVPERSFGELVSRGEIQVARDTLWDSGVTGTTQAGPDPWAMYFSRPEVARAVRKALAAKFPDQLRGPDGRWLRHEINEVTGYACVRDFPALLAVGAALDQDAVRAARSAGLGVTARLLNYPGIDPGAIDFMVREASIAKADAIVAAEKEVIGFPDDLGATADALARYGVAHGSVEFASQMGDQQLASLLGGHVLRVHSIEAKEMPLYTPRRAVERYVRAVRERNVRMLYVRLFLQGDPNPMAKDLAYCRDLRAALADAGYTTGAPSEIAAPRLSVVLILALACGVAAGVALLLTAFWCIRSWMQVVVCVAIAAWGGVAAVVAASMGAKLLALGAALTFPCLGIIDSRGIQGVQSQGGFWSRSVRTGFWVLVISLTSMAGGLLIAALLSRVPYMTQTDQFRGVKLSLVLPLLAVGAVYVTGAFAREETLRGWWSRVRAEGAAWLRSPVLLWQAMVVVLALGALALMLTRSGNAPPIGVSSLELKLRAWFDAVLSVRPRTKEFAFGHPLLFLGLALAREGRRRFVPALVVLGAVGQVSLVNTFCHLQTPIVYTLLRTVNGLVLGLILGVILYALVRLFSRHT